MKLNKKSSLFKSICLTLALSIALQPLHTIAQAQPLNSDRSIGVIEWIANTSETVSEQVRAIFSGSDRANIEAEGAALQDAIDGKNPYHELDTFRLFAQNAIDMKRPARFDLNAIIIELFDSNGNKIGELNQRSSQVFRLTSNEKVTFRLSYQGKSFLEFIAPIDSVGFVGNNVVFTEPNRFDKVHKIDHINFIDLKKYRTSIGKTALPVFRVAVDSPNGDSQLYAAHAATVKINNISVLPEVLAVYSDTQEAAFNISASMADPDALEKSEPLVDSFQNYFLRNLDLQGDTLKEQAELLAGGQTALEAFGKKHKEALKNRQAESRKTDKSAILLELDKMSDNIAKNTIKQKKLFSRIRLLYAQLTLPQPNAVPKLATAMALVATGIKKKAVPYSEVARHIINSRSVQMGAAIATGVALGATYPAETAAFFYNGLDVTRTVFDAALGKIKDVGYLLSEATKATIAGFNPVTFKEAYLTTEELPKVGVGLAAIFTTLYLAIGLPHIATNTFYLVRDFKTVSWGQRVEQEGGWWNAIKSAFIERQARIQKTYINSLAQDSKLSSSEQLEFTQEQNLEIEQIINNLKTKEKSGFFGRWLGKSSERKEPKQIKIESFAGALRHFLFSYATFTISGKAYTQIWNSWFAMRSFIWNPSIVASVLLFPNIWGLVSQGRVPNELNGGSRTRFTEMRMKLFDKTRLAELESWENALLDVEAKISKQVMRKTLTELTLHLENSKDLQKIFTSTGVNKISDKVLSELDSDSRNFFRVYYDRLLDKSLRHYLTSKGMDVQNSNLDDLKTPASVQDLNITVSEATAIVNDAATSALAVDVRRDLDKLFSPSAAKSKFKTKLTSRLAPENNRQISRIETVNRQANKPQAMARAVRGMIASNIVDKPMELMFIFMCFAGIQQGMLAPIQDEMFSENSWFHLSKMIFSQGFIYGVISGVFADIWMKLQMDEKNEGSFENVPTGQDAEGSFLKYYFKKTFKTPENSLWKNHLHNLKIIWANMKAAFTTMFLVGLATLGRFDIDAYVVGYLFAYFSPMSALSMKLEQGFELASAYYAKDIPEQYRSHPKAQEYLNTTLSKKRLWFNVFFKTYENIIGNLIMTFQMGKTALLGTRSFSRILLGGFTFTEVSALGLRTAGEAAGKIIPGAGKIADACETILTNNYTDWEKVPAKK
jgi:hypothetical protein